MGRWGAYLVTVGTEPGVYDSWDEAADRVMNVPGAIYKGFPSKQEAQNAFRKAQAQGRVRAVQTGTNIYHSVPPPTQTATPTHSYAAPFTPPGGRLARATSMQPSSPASSYHGARTSSSPTTGVTKIEPGFSSRSVSAMSSPASHTRSPQRIVRSRTLDAQVQTYNPPTSPVPRSPATPRGSASYCTCHSTCPKCHQRYPPELRSASRSPWTGPKHEHRSPPRSPKHEHRSPSLTPNLTPLVGLGLSQPMHASNVMYEAGQDPRSPVHRTMLIPASVPIFNRPSPHMSIDSVLFRH
ncbi:hypothetical protein SCP_0308770 [Sparassis crispa]|uniref:Ribonuclease H1 N-terminal domain-containing protein n=1 Tax=Sparassis crispa TaxID=139825 RepID=A0A401GGA3_9APHY|nr:hypothetical protein SCP_0308770 [Sparassis crispa]GBE81151.1 hypothetical protein SCP_0308770 [Sparassis crispa]